MIFFSLWLFKKKQKTSFPSGRRGRRGRRDPFEWLPCVLFFLLLLLLGCYYYYAARMRWLRIVFWWWGRGICFSCGASATFRNSDDDVEMNNTERIHFLAFLSFFNWI